MNNLKNLFIKNVCLIIEKFYSNIENYQNKKNQLLNSYRDTFNVASTLIQLIKESKHSTNEKILAVREIIKIFRAEVLLPFLVEYDDEFLPFLKSDNEFKNIIIDSVNHNNIDHDRWVSEIIIACKKTLSQIKKIIVS